MPLPTRTDPLPATTGPKLRHGRRPIALKLPPELVAEIDAIAAAETRPRTNLIEYALRRFVQSYRERDAA